MLYRFDGEMREIGFSELDERYAAIGLITPEELGENNDMFQFSEETVRECMVSKGGFRSSIDVYDEYSFGLFNIVNTENILGERDRVGFYLKKNLFLMVNIRDEDGSLEELFETALRQFSASQVTMERLIYAVLERLLCKDYHAIEKMEFEINSLENTLISQRQCEGFEKLLLQMKKKLMVLHNYYEQLIEVGEELQEDGNGLFEDANLRYFKLFTDKVTRLSNNVNLMGDNLVQLREIYESMIEGNRNNIMTIFTVVTTIFLPLTLIVGWYGMNFTTMPELTWKYGYLTVIVLSIAVVAFCLCFFKKKKLL